MTASVTYDGDIEIGGYELAETVAQLNHEAPVYVAYFLAPLEDGKVASCRIPIHNFPIVYKEIGEILKRQSIPSTVIADMRWLNLKSMCPSCGCGVTGRNLGTLYMMSRDGWDSIVIAGDRGIARRWGGGHCPNAKCDQREVLLLWFPVYDSLTKRKDAEAALALLESDYEWFYRKKVAGAIASFGPTVELAPRIIELLRMLRDRDPVEEVRQAARSALDVIKKEQAG